MSNSGDGRNAAATARPRLFLSYTRADIATARRIIAVLEQAGFDVWWDGLLEGGVNYLPTTEAALEEADCVVVLWSSRSVESSWVRDEAQRGRERNCLIPVSIDGTMSPLGFRQIQLIDITGWTGKPDAEEARRIVTAIKRQCANGEAVSTGGWSARPVPTAIAAGDPPETGHRFSRRGVFVGGLGMAGAAAAFGAWQTGLFDGVGDEAMSMAVLSFANLTGDEEQAWFSSGLSNELRQALSRNPRLRVSAPTSSTSRDDEDDFALGRALGVTSILRGSVQRVAETVRIFAELVQVDDGLVLWSDSYDRDFADVLAVQSEIAETVALSLVTRIAGQYTARQSIEQQKGVGGTSDIAAYEAYLRGMALSELSAGPEIDRAALDQFETAIASDQSFAGAHAMRATMLAAVANSATSSEEVERLYAQSIAAAQRSINLEPDLPRGHLALGFALNNGQLDRKGAYPHYKRAEELATGDADTQRAVAIFYAYGDQQALANQMIDRVLELDPLNARAFRAAGFVALFSRDYSATISRMKEALSLNPNLASAHYAIGIARLMQGDLPGARSAFETESVTIFSQTGLAVTLAKLGDMEGARAAFTAFVDQYGDASLYQQAQVRAQRGESDLALELLARAFDQRDPGALFATNDPLLDPLRDTERFKGLLLRLSD